MGKKSLSKESDQIMHDMMLKQLGLSSDAPKAKISKNQSDGSENENEEKIIDDGKLTLGDIFKSIDKSKGVGTSQVEDVINTNRL